MHLVSLATAVPDAAYTQADCWEIARHSPARARLGRAAQRLLETVLCGDSGIRRRHFALPDVGGLFDLSADELNAAYRTAAPALAARALERALASAGHAPRDLDALIVCSCTGYLCPGVSSYVAERMGLRPDALLLDVVGQGCGAALPTLRAADHVIAAQPDALVATVAVEICSAAFYLDDDPGVIVSACIFGDGAAAALWRARPAAAGVQCGNFTTRHWPEHRDRLRFEQRSGKLRNLLHLSVPQLAAGAVKTLRHATPDLRPVERLVVHPGGREVINAVELALGAPLPSSRAIMADYGNMSSPSVLFVLEHALREAKPRAGADWWLASFGAGFSAHGCRLAASEPAGWQPARSQMETAGAARGG